MMLAAISIYERQRPALTPLAVRLMTARSGSRRFNGKSGAEKPQSRRQRDAIGAHW
jgi:hypothetical protein